MKYTIYKHTSPDGKVYFGATRQKPEHRWNHGKGYKYNKLFWADIQKYTWSAFKHEIVATVDTKEQAYAIEIKMIKHYDATNPERGYNQSTGGAGFNGIKLTEAQRQRISEVNKGIARVVWTDEMRKKASFRRKGKPSPTKGMKMSPETCRKKSESLKGHPGCEYNKIHQSKAVVQYDLNGNEVARYYSQKEAVRQTGFNVSSIHYCCEGTRKTTNGYIFRYEKEVLR